MTIKGNCLIAQSGGPTAVINNSICGLISEALQHKQIETIYGGLFGIKGVLKQKFLNFNLENKESINSLLYTPGAALGSCRYKLKNEDYENLLYIFKKNNIKYFFYIGGNDSMDTANKLNKFFSDSGYKIIVIGVPKTIDNDLPHTDHCPGYGSAAKYIATYVLETGIDLQGIIGSSNIVIYESMGRNAGWLTAAAALAKNSEEDAPHLIYIPEITFNKEKFLKDVKSVYNKLGYVYIVASEGLKDKYGNYIGAEKTKDAFGHVKLGNGVANALKEILLEEMKVKVRCNIPGTSQRSTMYCASKTDAEEAFMLGKEAVKFALKGLSGIMLTLKRYHDEKYLCKAEYIELNKAANKERLLPVSMINKDKNFVTKEFISYARPLIQGNINIPMKNGLPAYTKLNGYRHFK